MNNIKCADFCYFTNVKEKEMVYSLHNVIDGDVEKPAI